MHITSAFLLFQDIINNNLRVDICIKTYVVCLDIIEFFTRNLRSKNELMHKYGETLFEMLVRIESKLKQEDWTKYEFYEAEINEIFEYINKFIS